MCFKVYVLSPETGRELVLTTERPYHAVAELPSLDGGSYPANAQALAASERLFPEQRAFLGVLLERPEVSLHLVQTLGRRLRRLIGLVEQLSFQEVIHRLARYLLARGEAELPFELETNAAIAAQLGTVPELVSRNLSRLQQSGVLTLSQRRVTQIDEAALRELAGGARR
jgi:CRP-like cAMP-binding protein